MRSEQVSTDRQQRRSKYIVEHHESTCETFCPRCAEAAHKPRPEGFHSSHKILEPPAAAFNAQPRFKSAKEQRPWTRLDQALRATDLLLQAGGFSAIVLDLGSIGPEHASRIPLATWFRFRQVADHSRTSLIVLAQNSCAKSSAALLLRFEPMTALGSTVMEAAQFEAGNQRQRFVASSAAFPPPAFHAANARKQPQATWQSTAYSLACDQQYKQPRKLKGST